MDGAFQMAQQCLPTLMLITVRVGTTLAALPAPFGSVAPMQIRAVLGLLLSFVLGLPLISSGECVEQSMVQLACAAFGEAFIGAVIGLTVRVTLAAADIAGSAAGFSMGLGFASSVNPAFEESSETVSSLLSILATALFLAFQGHHIVLRALAATLRVAPPGHTLSVLMQDGVLRVGTTLMAQSLRIAMPVMATLFIVQLGTGLVARVAPRVHLFALTFSIAAAAGMLALFVAAPSIAYVIAAQVEHLSSNLSTALGGF